MPSAPAASRANEKAHELVTTGSPEQPGIPCAMVLAVYFEVSPETGLDCLRPLRDARHHRKVDTSVGVSGRHDFAVRIRRTRQLRRTRPSHPAPDVRDDREAPLEQGGTTGITKAASSKRRSEIFFAKGLARRGKSAGAAEWPDGEKS